MREEPAGADLFPPSSPLVQPTVALVSMAVCGVRGAERKRNAPAEWLSVPGLGQGGGGGGGGGRGGGAALLVRVQLFQ